MQMHMTFSFLVQLFEHTFTFWWIIIPAIFLGPAMRGCGC